MATHRTLDDAALAQIFRDARTHRRWLDRPVEDDTLHALWDLLRMAPTSANCSPARLLFLRSAAAKERLRPALIDSNVNQTMKAPVTAIVAYDLEFAEHLPRLYPFADARSWFAGNELLTATTAFRNGSLQGAYLIVAARALGLDCGPMSGFDNDAVDAVFFPGGRVRSNFLCNLGYGEPDPGYRRAPRLSFGEACDIL